MKGGAKNGNVREGVSRESFPGSPKKSMREVKAEVVDVFGISREDLEGRSRSRTLVMARKLFAARARVECGASMYEIGKMLGGRAHTTVKYYLDGFKKVKAGE